MSCDTRVLFFNETDKSYEIEEILHPYPINAIYTSSQITKLFDNNIYEYLHSVAKLLYYQNKDIPVIHDFTTVQLSNTLEIHIKDMINNIDNYMDTNVIYKTYMGYFDGTTTNIFIGQVSGSIIKGKDSNNFESCFVPKNRRLPLSYYKPIDSNPRYYAIKKIISHLPDKIINDIF